MLPWFPWRNNTVINHLERIYRRLKLARAVLYLLYRVNQPTTYKQFSLTIKIYDIWNRNQKLQALRLVLSDALRFTDLDVDVVFFSIFVNNTNKRSKVTIIRIDVCFTTSFGYQMRISINVYRTGQVDRKCRYLYVCSNMVYQEWFTFQVK